MYSIVSVCYVKGKDQWSSVKTCPHMWSLMGLIGRNRVQSVGTASLCNDMLLHMIQGNLLGCMHGAICYPYGTLFNLPHMRMASFGSLQPQCTTLPADEALWLCPMMQCMRDCISEIESIRECMLKWQLCAVSVQHAQSGTTGGTMCMLHNRRSQQPYTTVVLLQNSYTVINCCSATKHLL